MTIQLRGTDGRISLGTSSPNSEHSPTISDDIKHHSLLY